MRLTRGKRLTGGSGWRMIRADVKVRRTPLHWAREGSCFVAICALVVLPGCDSEVELEGTYRFEGTSIVTGLDDPGGGCGLPGFPSNRYKATFTVGPRESGRTSVTEVVSECTFPARISGT